MRNPLIKRIPRELKQDIGKYIVIFLFLTLTIGFVSGFLVADGSMIEAYNESFEKYRIEDGNFELTGKANEELLEHLENEKHIEDIYNNFYLDETTGNGSDEKDDNKLRIFINRTRINKVCLMEGAFPDNKDEIAIDRMYADNNELKTGDFIEVGDRKLKITGLVALSDYSALFSDNSDMMFDSVKFGVAVMTEEGFETFGNRNLHYNYSWEYDSSPKDETQEKEWSEDFAQQLAIQTAQYMGDGTQIVKYIPQYANQAIHFTGDDMGKDSSMMITLLYILLVIIAFVFAVTISHTITGEAAVIGTLRASGYKKGELLRHYITLPLIVTLIGAIIGNILGYTVFKNVCASMYYGSYSLPTYETRWNMDAFWRTTIVPVAAMFIINVVIIWHKLSFSPLQFLRKDLTRKKKKKAMKLPHFNFFTRFRLRIIFQNLSSYITLFIGITFAQVLLLFGMMMTPLLDHFQEDTLDNMLAQYQYVLKQPVQTDEEMAEKYCVGTLVTLEEDGNKSEDITIYGVEEDSRYVKNEMPENGVLISDCYADKYNLGKGDKIKLEDKYTGEEHVFDIKGIYKYPGALAVFMAADSYQKEFDKEEDYFNGYFAEEEMDSLDKEQVLSVITEEEMTKVSRQLDVSMGSMFFLVNVFSVVLFLVLMYLLTKLIIEKNASSISMVKILGYENGEISRLYLLATTWVVVVSVLLSLLIATAVLTGIYRQILSSMTGWLTIYIAPWIYPVAFVLGLASYGVVAMLQLRKIRKIPMEEALKNVE